MIYEHLKKGAKNAISCKELSKVLGYDKSTVKELVRRDRYAGIPIISSSRGYYMPESTEEIKDLIIRFRTTAKRHSELATAIQKGFNMDFDKELNEDGI